MSANLLLVEDEKIHQDILSEYFSSNGIASSVADNGKEALKSLEKEAFDLMITDIQMPKMDGVALAKEARYLYPDMPIIIVSGFANLDVALDLMNNIGAEGLFTKPLNEDELLEKVKKCLNRIQLAGAMHHSAKMHALGELTASVTHELRNSLSQIKLAVKLMNGDLGNLQKYKQIISDGADRSQRIIGSLLSFSRKAENVTTIPFDNLFQSLLVLVDDKIKLQSVEVDLCLEKEAIKSIPDSLHIIFLNLIINAINAMEEKGEGTLSIKSRSLDGKVVVEIGDTGSGIDKENLERIWDIFYTTKGENGNGLGLAIVKKEVENLGGEITVRSELGIGTFFSVALPGKGQ